MHKRNASTTFYCFSPPVMLATFSIETALAAYTIIRYRMTVLTRLIVASLLMLGLFQLCEYHVCGGWGMTAERWSRLGYVAISTLPPLGLHIMHRLAGKPQRQLVAGSYLLMLAFVGYFLWYPQAFTGYKCTGNYVIFQLGQRATWLYALYYYGLLFAALWLGVKWANELVKAGNKAARKLQTVRGMMVGYLVFLVPTVLANSVSPQTRSGIPSIMCGFAVLFALILTLYILPRAVGERHHQRVKFLTE